MGPLTLVRAAEEHGGPHSAWFWDPTQQGGGVLSDMGCHSIAVGRYLLTPRRPSRRASSSPRRCRRTSSLLKWGQPRWRAELLERHGVDYARTPAEDFATGLVTYRDPETGQRDAGAVHGVVDVRQAGPAAARRRHRPGLRARGEQPALAARGVHRRRGGRVGRRRRARAREGDRVARVCSRSNRTSPTSTATPTRTSTRSPRSATGRSALLDFDDGLDVVRLTMAAYMSAEQRPRRRPHRRRDARRARDLRAAHPAGPRRGGRCSGLTVRPRVAVGVIDRLCDREDRGRARAGRTSGVYLLGRRVSVCSRKCGLVRRPVVRRSACGSTRLIVCGELGDDVQPAPLLPATAPARVCSTRRRRGVGSITTTGTLQNERRVCGSLRYTTDCVLLEHTTAPFVTDDLARGGDHREQTALLGHLRDVADRAATGTRRSRRASTIASERRSAVSPSDRARARARRAPRTRGGSSAGNTAGRKRRAAQTWSGVIARAPDVEQRGRREHERRDLRREPQRAAHERRP